MNLSKSQIQWIFANALNGALGGLGWWFLSATNQDKKKTDYLSSLKLT